MPQINLLDVAEKYNSIQNIWDENDKWHLKTKAMIAQFIKNSLKIIGDYGSKKILNAGSAGYSYGLEEKNIVHIDIAQKKIQHIQNSLVASIEEIPLPDASFELIICVGSVLNYCDPIKVMDEFRRVLKPSGHLILEFENSYTFELIGKQGFNRKAAFVETFYNGYKEKLWFFSESFIKDLANLHLFRILSKDKCHILSPLIYRLFKNETVASKFTSFDKICSHLPVLNNFSSNVIYLMRK